MSCLLYSTDVCLLCLSFQALLFFGLHCQHSSMGFKGSFTLLFIVIAYCSTTASAARSPGQSQRSLLTRTLSGAPIDAGLQDAKVAVNGTIPVGHLLSGQGLWASTSYSSPSQLGGFKTSGAGVWGQVCILPLIHVLFSLVTNMELTNKYWS